MRDSDSWPIGRFGAASAVVGGYLIFFGGRTLLNGTDIYMGDTWLYSPATRAWQQPPLATGGPSPRAYGMLAVVGTTVYLFGGYSPTGSYNDLWSCTPTTAWTRVDAAGAPSARSGGSLIGYAASGSDTQLLLYGGLSSALQPLGEVWSFSASLRTWTQVQQPSAGPSTRYGSGLTCVSGGQSLCSQVYMFGGAGNVASQSYNDLWHGAISGASVAWTRVHAVLPPVRREFVMWQDGGKLYAWGGIDMTWSWQTYQLYDDLWQYDISARTWTQVPQFGPIPQGRMDHAIVHFTQNGTRKLLVHGGRAIDTISLDDLYIFEKSNFTWFRTPSTYPSVPPYHLQNAGVIGNTYFLYAGRTISQPGARVWWLWQLWAMNLTDFTWRLLDDQATLPLNQRKPPARGWGLSWTTSDAWYLFGGFTLPPFGGPEFNKVATNWGDLWRFRLLSVDGDASGSIPSSASSCSTWKVVGILFIGISGLLLLALIATIMYLGRTKSYTHCFHFTWPNISITVLRGGGGSGGSGGDSSGGGGAQLTYTKM